MSILKIPTHITLNIEAHNKWCALIKLAEKVIADDLDLQHKAERGLRLKERYLPVEVLGRMYAQYCYLINQMYDSYLSCAHLQRAPYMLDLITVCMKRMFELRKELVFLIVNDYIYMDIPLTQLKMMPSDIEIVVPYHFPLEARADSVEQLLQKMWADAVKRKKKAARLAAKPPKTPVERTSSDLEFLFDDASEEVVVEEETPEPSVHTISIVPEQYTQAVIIQTRERFRQWFKLDFKSKCIRRRMLAPKIELPPIQMLDAAARVIQRVYREYMKIKRSKYKSAKRDILLGMIPDPFEKKKSFREASNKVYDIRRRQRERMQEFYQKDMEKEHKRLLIFKKEDQIDDITEEVREWFMEWYNGYGYFPQYPYDVEGGTIMVIRGDYPTIDEQIEADEKLAAAMKGKTKEMLQREREQAKEDAALKAILEKEKAQKEAMNLFKARCNPFTDPGYQAQKSAVMEEVSTVRELAFLEYRAAWSFFDSNPSEVYADAIYGYMKSILCEDLMEKIHLECRQYVDQLMRLDLKLLIKMQQTMFMRIGHKFPKLPPRKKPKVPSPQNDLDNALTKNIEGVFDLQLVSKPTQKLEDIWGDSNYAAADLNVRDPDAKFPAPGYGDIKRRLVLSCIFGSGIAAGATKNKSVLLIGPPRNGKSFLVDCVAGEMNAVKIDITPEVFSAVCQKQGKKPAKVLAQVMAAARTFQPSVIFLKNIERVYAKKILPQDKYLRAKAIKKPLSKLMKTIAADEKIIFIATCSEPLAAKAKPMVALFDEMILVPVADYNSLQMFFYNKLQSIRSIPRDYCVQPLAQLFRGYGFGLVMETYHKIMTPERIITLNCTPLNPMEFLNPILESGIDPVPPELYKVYLDFFLNNSPLKNPRMEYEFINAHRADAYEKQAKKEAKKQKNKQDA